MSDELTPKRDYYRASSALSSMSRNNGGLVEIKGSSSVRKSLNESRKSSESPNRRKYSSNGRSSLMDNIEENENEIDRELEDLKKIK